MVLNCSHAWDPVRVRTWSPASDLTFTCQVTQRPLAQRHYCILGPRRSLTALQTHNSIFARNLRHFDPTTRLDLDQTEHRTPSIMARGKRVSRLRDAVPAEPEPDNTTAEVEAEIPDAHEQVLDPATSERCYWRDPLTGVQREIWRPGTFSSKRIV
jgi:hypothetical protein